MRRIPSPATILAVIAVIIAGAGSAVAATVITGKQIKNGSIGLKDLSKKAKNGLKGKQGAQGPQGPQGPAGQNGTNGTNGINGADGSALAYAVVNPNPPSPNFVDGKMKGFNGLYQAPGNTGIYCLRVEEGINILDRPRVATVDTATTTNALGNKTVVVRQGPAGGSACPLSTAAELERTIEVRTYTLEILSAPPAAGDQINNDPSNEVGFVVIVG